MEKIIIHLISVMHKDPADNTTAICHYLSVQLIENLSQLLRRLPQCTNHLHVWRRFRSQPLHLIKAVQYTMR